VSAVPLNQRSELCWNLFRKAQDYRAKNKDAIWQQIAEYEWGDQNIRRDTDGSQNDFVYNLVYRDKNAAMALLCRGVPTYDITPFYESLLPTKQPIEDAVNAVWYSNDPAIRLVELVSLGLSFGTSFYKITWDSTMMMGLGGIRIQVPDTRNIYFMPGISRVKDSLIMFERRYVDKLTALSLYPDQADAINELFSLSPSGIAGSGSIAPAGAPIYIDVEGTVSQTYLNHANSMTPEKGQIELVESWFIDNTTVNQVPKLFDEIKKTKRYKSATLDEKDAYGKTMLYPRGRVKVHSGSHEFDDRPNPFPSFPYTQYVNSFAPTAKPGDELPMGEFDNLLEVQDMFNARTNQIMDAMDNTAFGGFGVTDGIFDVDEFEARPRKIYKTNRLGNFQWVSPASVPAEAFKSQQDIFSLANQLQNRQNVMAGETGDIRSGDAVDTLVDIADRSMITRTHSLEACHVNASRYIMSMIGAFYIPGVHYPEQLAEQLQGLSPAGYKITAKAGMNLPANKQAANMERRMLLDAGVIDQQAVLDNIDTSILPNRSEVTQRMLQTWEAQKQAAKQQAMVDQNEQNAAARANLARVVPMPQGA
jgi:hypothetical protein